MTLSLHRPTPPDPDHDDSESTGTQPGAAVSTGTEPTEAVSNRSAATADPPGDDTRGDDAASAENATAARRPRVPTFGLSVTQLAAAALAATTATFASSYLGVAGTVTGAALASLVSGIGTAVYSRSLQRTRDTVRGAVPVLAARTGATSVLPAAREQSVDRRDTPPELPAGRTGNRLAVRVALVALTVFVGVLSVVTVVELATGRPVSDLVRDKSGAGTSFFGDAQVRTVAPRPTVTVTVVPKVVVTTPTSTVTAPARTSTVPAGTASASGSAASSSPSATSSASPSATSSATGSGSATP